MSPLLVVRYPSRSALDPVRRGLARESLPWQACVEPKEATMGEKLDETKGRTKEAAGDLTGNKDLEREGQMDQAGAKVKKNAGAAVDKTKEAVDDVLDRDEDR
jgi:uncharacterized protein YjbJ (UPF0337 family)